MTYYCKFSVVEFAPPASPSTTQNHLLHACNSAAASTLPFTINTSHTTSTTTTTDRPRKRGRPCKKQPTCTSHNMFISKTETINRYSFSTTSPSKLLPYEQELKHLCNIPNNCNNTGAPPEIVSIKSMNKKNKSITKRTTKSKLQSLSSPNSLMVQTSADSSSSSSSTTSTVSDNSSFACSPLTTHAILTPTTALTHCNNTLISKESHYNNIAYPIINNNNIPPPPKSKELSQLSSLTKRIIRTSISIKELLN